MALRLLQAPGSSSPASNTDRDAAGDAAVVGRTLGQAVDIPISAGLRPDQGLDTTFVTAG